MCTYLGGKLIAFTGTLPPVFDWEPELEKTMIASGECEPMRMTRDQEVARARRKDRKTISRGEKIIRLIPGDKLHNHGKHIRCLKGNLKRGFN